MKLDLSSKDWESPLLDRLEDSLLSPRLLPVEREDNLEEDGGSGLPIWEQV